MRLMAWLQHWRFAFINHQAVMLSPFAHALRTVLSVAKELRVNSAKHLLSACLKSRFFVAALLRMTTS